jgi:hypothetical protein
MIKYNYKDWDNQFLDSTTNQWILNRYGKELLYKNYTEAFDEAVEVFNNHDIRYTICDSRKCINENDFDYLFDYKQKNIDNHESKVADRRLGGFFFKNLKTNKKYEPIVEKQKIYQKNNKKSTVNSSASST